MRALAARAQASCERACDALVIGSGVSGMSAALGLQGKVVVVTKTAFGHGGSSRWAQGGVAAAMGGSDTPSQHALDTERAGAGLCDPEVVSSLLAEGPGRLRELIALGARFDRDAEGRLLMGREAAHSQQRILHAGGDATGAEMVRALVAALRRHPEVTVQEQAFAEDLVVADGRVVGALVLQADGRRVLYSARAVVLACGGFGQLYAYTTNPPEVTGDGLAMAARAGAVLADLEMVQFHPTALAVERDPLPLVTEALRGEGATLVDSEGHRFMPAEHPLAELAPRDVVARALWRQQRDGGAVYLVPPRGLRGRFRERFPTVWKHCRDNGIDPRWDRLPVTPAAHYAMAGVAIDGRGRSSLPGLWACGEVSASGLHGANRLASNSLLEALVMGARVAEDLVARAPARPVSSILRRAEIYRETARVSSESSAERRQQIRRIMWREVGLERDHQGLERALEQLGALGVASHPGEVENLRTVGLMVSAAALAREESRGAHRRRDFPQARADLQQRACWRYQPDSEYPLRLVRTEHTERLSQQREIA